MSITIELMAEKDLPKVAKLLQTNSASQNGGLLGEFPLEKVRQMFESSLSAVVARKENIIAGVVFSFPLDASQLPPLVTYINERFPEITKNNWLYGPVCIDINFRGGTVLHSLFNKICKQNNGQPIAFINSDNQRSIHAHEKLGMNTIAKFTFKEIPYVLVSTISIKKKPSKFSLKGSVFTINQEH